MSEIRGYGEGLKQANVLDIGFYIAFGAYNFFHTMESTNFETILGIEIDTLSNVVIIASIFLLIVRMISMRYSHKELFLVGVMFVIALLVFVNTQSWICLALCIFICAGKRVKLRPVLHMLLWTSLIVLLMAWIGDTTGAIDSVSYSRGGASGMRDSMGFWHPNAHGFVFAKICTAIACLSWGRHLALQTILFLSIAGFISATSDSRTAELYIVLLAVAVIASGKLSHLSLKGRRVATAVLGTSVVSAIVISLLLMVAFNPANSLLMSLNDLLSSRLYSAWYLYHQYSFSIFGNGSTEFSSEVWLNGVRVANTVDNAWVLWVICYGLVALFVLVVGIVLLYRKAFREGYFSAILVVLSLLLTVYACSETSALTIDFNPLLIVLASVIFSYPIEVHDGGVAERRATHDGQLHSKKNSLHLVRG